MKLSTIASKEKDLGMFVDKFTEVLHQHAGKSSKQ